jgi:integrase
MDAPTLIGTALQDWEAERRRLGHSAAEIRKGSLAVRRVLAGVSTVQEIGPRRVRVWLGEYLQAGASAKSHNNMASRLRAFGEHCRRAGWLPTNPLAEVEMIRADEGEGSRPFSTAELDALVRTTAEYEAGDKRRQTGRAAVYVLAAYTGLRLGELGRLRWEHVTQGADGWAYTLPGRLAKSRRREGAPLAPAAVLALQALRRLWPDSPVVCAKIPSRHTFERDLSRACPNIPAHERPTFHGLRKWLANELDRVGARSKVAQSILRHKPATLMQRAYQRATPEEMRADLQKLPQLDCLSTTRGGFFHLSRGFFPVQVDSGAKIADAVPVPPPGCKSSAEGSESDKCSTGVRFPPAPFPRTPAGGPLTRLIDSQIAALAAIRDLLTSEPGHGDECRNVPSRPHPAR